jgi:ubiquinone/menaquinone biosynthesis C-methylase UbiE
MTRPEKFWNRMANRYSKSPVSDEATYQKKLKATQAYFKPDMELLELGCGTGSTAIVHAPFVKHIRATDFSSNMIEIAKSKTEAAGIDNITYECASVETVTAPDNSLDMVLALSVLHLLPNKEEAIARVFRMLKPGGLFVTSTVCIADFLKIFKYIGPIGRSIGLLPYIDVFTRIELDSSLSAAGFETELSWPREKKKSAFIILKKPEDTAQ